MEVFTWGCNNGNLEIGEIALQHLVQLEPKTCGNYVLLSNMYAHVNRWDDVKRLRNSMEDHGIDKMPYWAMMPIYWSISI